MLTELLLFLSVSLALTLALTLALNSIQSRNARLKFKKSLKGVPFLDKDVGWFSNNLLALGTGQNSQLIHKRHMELGDTLGAMIGIQPTISTIDLDLIKHVCLDKASKNINRIRIDLPMKEYENDCLLFAQDDQWRRIRKSFAPALKPAQIKTPNVVGEVESSIEQLLGGIDRELERGNSVFNMDDLMHRFSLNIVMGCFYKQYNQINFDLSQADHWVEMIDRGIEEFGHSKAIIFALIIPAFRHVIDFVVYHLHPHGKWRSNVLAFVKRQARLGFEARKQLAELKRQNPNQDENNFTLKDGSEFHRNIADHIVDQFHAGKLSTNEFFNSSAFLFAAGDKTAADALVFTLYNLAINKEMQEKLRQSIKQDGDQSEYLLWVLYESLRLSPPAPGGPSRILSEEVKLEKFGVTLAKGTNFYTPLYTIHRLKRYWGEDAEEFKPERWANEEQFHPCQFMPFGAGLRTCLGQNFAKQEIKLLLCALLKRYEFHCPKPKDDLDDFCSPLTVFLLHKSPFNLEITRLKE